MENSMSNPVPMEVIESKIVMVNGQKVILDADLAILYGVTTKALNQAVKRNIKRFPKDFMFQPTQKDADNMRSQFVTASKRNVRFLPYAFTEHGVIMAASVLNSQRAIDVSVYVVRAFIKLRIMLSANKDLSNRLDELERKYDGQFKVVFDAIRELMTPPQLKRKKIGFKLKEKKAIYKKAIQY
jgi:hypothetical protein